MNYDIKLIRKSGQSGVDFDQLEHLAHSTRQIAQRALMLKVFGYSGVSLPAYCKDAVRIRLESVTGNASEGIRFLLDADPFAGKLGTLQVDVFRPQLAEELRALTPMALVIQTFRAALLPDAEKNDLDKPLLKSLLSFKKSFISGEETFFFSNRGTVPEVSVTLDDFKRIELLNDDTPEPRKTIVMGKLDEMKYSKSRFVLLTREGPVNVLVRQQADEMVALKDFFGEDVTIEGEAHFRPGGLLSFIELHTFAAPGKTDTQFSRIPSALSARQQVLFKIKKGKSLNPLASLLGQWPGDETDEEYEQLLKDMGK